MTEKFVSAAELMARALGADIHAFDEQGRGVIDEVGELVLTQPMPSMPLRCGGDEDGSRLHEAYVDMYPGVWRHGDWIKIEPDGPCVIYGRSGSPPNRGGGGGGRGVPGSGGGAGREAAAPRRGRRR